MTRWAPDPRARIERAAIELFAERGFAATTVEQITDRAGLTRRTFFRHFSDKREVLFGDDEIPELAARLLSEAPAGVDPLVLVRAGLDRVAALRFESDRDRALLVRGLIEGDAGLRERDLRKRVDLAQAIREGFVARGEAPVDAAVLASVAVDLLHVALDAWLDDAGAAPLRHHLARAFDSLERMVAARPAAG